MSVVHQVHGSCLRQRWTKCHICVSGAVQVPLRDSARVHVEFVFVFQEQYKFLYEIALEYMSQYDEYANFR